MACIKGFSGSFTATEKECCQVALTSFQEGNHQECSELYTQVLEGRSETNTSASHRLRHNILLSNFYGEEFRDVDTFYQGLRNILLEADIKIDKLTYDNSEEQVILFNIAVLYFHHKQFQRVADITEKLLQELSNILNHFSTRVRLLFIESLFRLQHYDRCIIELEHFESQLRRRDSSSTSPTDIFEQLNKPLLPLAFKEIDYEFNVINERIQLYKVLCFLGMNSLVAAKRECKLLLSTVTQNKKETRIALQLKSHFEYLRQNPIKAIKMLKNLLETNKNEFWSTGDELEIILMNNLGCCYYALGKPNIGCKHFESALKFCDKLEYKDKKKQPLHCRAYNKKYEIIYNLAVGMLQIQKLPSPSETFSYLLMCQKSFSSSAKMWLRLAESCIKIHQKNQEKQWNIECQSILRQIKEEDYSNSQVFININHRKPCQNAQNEVEYLKPSLNFGLECVQNALKLIQSEKVRREGYLYVKPGQPITSNLKICGLQANILCVGAFIACLAKDYATVVNYCSQILRLNNIPSVFTVLAKMYLSEALFKSLNMQEALKLLQTVDLNELRANQNSVSRIQYPSEDQSVLEFPIKSNLDVQLLEISLMFNKVLLLSLSGSTEIAIDLVEAWVMSASPTNLPIEMVLLMVNLYRKSDNSSQADNFLKRFT